MVGRGDSLGVLGMVNIQYGKEFYFPKRQQVLREHNKESWPCFHTISERFRARHFRPTFLQVRMAHDL